MVLATNKHCIFNLSYVDTVWPQVSSSGGGLQLSSTVSGLGEIQLTAGLSLKAGGRGLSPTTRNITPPPPPLLL